MKTLNIKQLRSYIEKVIDDACKEENRPNDVTFDAFVINNTALLLLLHCKYVLVQRRVHDRILRDVPERFGISVVDLYQEVRTAEPYYCAGDAPAVCVVRV